MTRCADLCHVPLDELDHFADVNGTPVASPSVADAIEAGYVVTIPGRASSPNGLAWPGVAPTWRPARQPEPCGICGPRGCRR